MRYIRIFKYIRRYVCNDEYIYYNGQFDPLRTNSLRPCGLYPYPTAASAERCIRRSSDSSIPRCTAHAIRARHVRSQNARLPASSLPSRKSPVRDTAVQVASCTKISVLSHLNARNRRLRTGRPYNSSPGIRPRTCLV